MQSSRFGEKQVTDGRNPRETYLAISAHLSVEERGLRHHDETTKRWWRHAEFDCINFLIKSRVHVMQ